MEENKKRYIWYIVASVIAAAAATLASLLTGCGQLYTLNKAVRYEYELVRESNTNTNTHLIISNDGKD